MKNHLSMASLRESYYFTNECASRRILLLHCLGLECVIWSIHRCNFMRPDILSTTTAFTTWDAQSPSATSWHTHHLLPLIIKIEFSYHLPGIWRFCFFKSCKNSMGLWGILNMPWDRLRMPFPIGIPKRFCLCLISRSRLDEKQLHRLVHRWCIHKYIYIYS